jgi:two-component sensor histidine kinase
MGALLQNFSDKVKLCYERAAEAKERADEMLDPEAKAEFLNVEKRWLLLARSYQFGESLDDFTRENSRRVESARAFRAKAPLLDADGQIVGLVGVAKDISEHRNREEEREVLLSELRHRLKNSLSLVQAIARQTINPGDVLERFEKRLVAHAQSEEVLLARSGKIVMLRELINAHRLAFNMDNRVSVHGADLPLTHNGAIQIGIAIHELASNSMKHGALGGDGHVTIIWTVESSGEEERNLVFIWDEIHSPSETRLNEPGFGYTVLTQIVPAQLNGTAALELEAGALRWTLQVAL